jgi:lysophospholipase L1-like esterase
MSPPETRFDKHSGKMLLAFWLLLFIAGLATLEWYLTPANGRYQAYGSASGPGPERRLVMREWEPNTDYRFAPTPERRRYASGAPKNVYELSTDANGFIEPALRHKNSDLDIVFMGGSTTECLYVDPENRFAYLSSRMLEGKLGLKINGINAGRAGNNSMHSLVLLLGKVLPLQPDYVVLMEAINDIGTLSKGTYWSETGSKRLIEVEKSSLDKTIRVLTNAVLPYTSDLVTRAWRPVKELLRGGAAQAAETEHSSVRAGEEFEYALRSFVGITRAWGIKPVLMTQVHVSADSRAEQSSSFLAHEPLARAQLDATDAGSLHDRFNEIIREVARDENVLLIDLARAEAWRYGDVYDGMHFTDQGSIKVAQVIASALGREISKRPNATN